MRMWGRCPKCEKDVTNLDVSALEAHVDFSRKFHAATFLCPHCGTILGAGIDPVALAEDLARRLQR
jgi:uncharacterized protein with PIN domain